MIPTEATPVPDGARTYYLWPEIINGVTPVVRIHISTWENPDDACDCRDRELGEPALGLTHEVLDACREQAKRMLWDEHHWVIRGTPETVITCSHDFDPRASTT